MMLKLEDQLEKGKIVIPTDISRDLLIQHRLLSKAVYDGAFSSPSLHLSSHPTSPHLSLHMYQGCPAMVGAGSIVVIRGVGRWRRERCSGERI